MEDQPGALPELVAKEASPLPNLRVARVTASLEEETAQQIAGAAGCLDLGSADFVDPLLPLHLPHLLRLKAVDQKKGCKEERVSPLHLTMQTWMMRR